MIAADDRGDEAETCGGGEQHPQRGAQERAAEIERAGRVDRRTASGARGGDGLVMSGSSSGIERRKSGKSPRAPRARTSGSAAFGTSGAPNTRSISAGTSVMRGGAGAAAASTSDRSSRG